MKKYAAIPLGVTLTVFLFLSGCNLLSGSKNSSTPTSISFQTTSSSSAPTVAPAKFGSVTTTDSMNNTIVIDTAKILVRALQFHGSQENDSSEVEFENNNGQKSGIGPFVINLNLDTTTVTPVGLGNVPNGTYSSVSFQIHKLTTGETVSDPDFSSGPAENQQYSVVVTGTYNGTPFVYKSQKTVEIHVPLNPPLVVSDTLKSFNATVQVNVKSWFMDRNGTLLDPNNPNNADKIDEAIDHSFHGFDDNNENGVDDHSESSHGDSGSGSGSGN